MSTADLFGTDSESEDDEFDPGPVNEEGGSEGGTPRYSSGGESSDEDGNQEIETTNARPNNQQRIEEEDDESNSVNGQEEREEDGDDDEEADERSYQSPKRDALHNEADQSDAEEDETPSRVSQKQGSYSESNDDENDEGSIHEEKKEMERDEEVEKPAAPTQEDIFGEELDVSSDEEDEPIPQETSQVEEPAEAREVGDEARADSQEEEQQQEEGVAIEIELPKVDTAIGDDVYFVKLPNFLSIETKPFDQAFYEDEIDEDEVLDDEGRARLKLKVENTLRWRHGKDREGNDIKESNARIVKWSDGSISLHLGNEIFDIFKMPIEGLQNHLFVQQGTGLQAKAVFREKFTFRPYSTKSQTHLKMTMSIAEKVSKTQKIQLIPVTDRDPEAARKEMTKKEEERMRAQMRRESQQRRMREKNASKGLTANYLESEIFEDDEQELEESLAAIKSKYKKDMKAGRSRDIQDIYSDDESDDNRLKNAKADLSSDEEGPLGAKRKSKREDSTKKKKVARTIAESDEESE